MQKQWAWPFPILFISCYKLIWYWKISNSFICCFFYIITTRDANECREQTNPQHKTIMWQYVCSWQQKVDQHEKIISEAFRVQEMVNISSHLRQWPTWYTLALFYNKFIIILYMFRALYVV